MNVYIHTHVCVCVGARVVEKCVTHMNTSRKRVEARRASCSVLQCVAVCCSVRHSVLQYVAVCCVKVAGEMW